MLKCVFFRIFALFSLGTEIRFLALGKIQFFDLFKLSTEKSLKQLGEMLDISSRTRRGLNKQYNIPYNYFVDMNTIESSEVPPLGHHSWAAMKDGASMCTAEEHAAVEAEVKRSGWYKVFSSYLKDVSLS